MKFINKLQFQNCTAMLTCIVTDPGTKDVHMMSRIIWKRLAYFAMWYGHATIDGNAYLFQIYKNCTS